MRPLELRDDPAARLLAGYAARRPDQAHLVIENVGVSLYPDTAGSVVDTVEEMWLGLHPTTRIIRHITNGQLIVQREGEEFDKRMTVTAATKEGSTPCPIVWGESLTTADGEKIYEPHVLAPENAEVVISLTTLFSSSFAILGAYDKTNNEPGMPPVRTPLAPLNGKARWYEGSQVAIIDEGGVGTAWSFPKVTTAVRSTSGGGLSTIEDGSPQTVLNGGIYLLVFPPKPSVEIAPKQFSGSDVFQGSGSTKFGDLFPNDYLSGIITREISPKTKGYLDEETRVGALQRGQTAGQTRASSFEPDFDKGLALILRLRTYGDRKGYLSHAAVAQSTGETITSRSAICQACGANAPKVVNAGGTDRQIYQWDGDNFTVVGDFNCAHCGYTKLEPVMVRTKASHTS